MLFELLEGNTPFPADLGGNMLRAGTEIPNINSNIYDKLKDLIYQMLSLNTWDRPTADQLLEIKSEESEVPPKIPEKLNDTNEEKNSTISQSKEPPIPWWASV